MSERPRLLVADPNPASRLAVLNALREPYEVIPLPEEEDPVRATRRIRPSALLLAVPSGRAQGALRACRSLKTEANPVKVAVLDPGGRLSKPEEAIEAWLADGILTGMAEPEALRAFVAAVLAGERPVVLGVVPGRGWIERLTGR